MLLLLVLMMTAAMIGWARYFFILLLSLPSPCLAADGLRGKVMCGYQGWFRTPGDGTNNGWHHYAPGKIFAPGQCHIDLWPDVRELPVAERFATPFRHPDGSVAEVFSSARPAAVALHFQWMKQHGIDGIFLQRFAATTRDERFRRPQDGILDACRKAAADTGRSWVPMYDLSGVTRDAAQTVITDWKRLEAQFRLTDAAENPALLRHRGKPLVALWGCGFDDRPAMLDEWRAMITYFRKDADCAVMLGVPAWWRTLERDAITDPALHEVLRMADVISPWNVGRYGTPDEAARHAARVTSGDVAWCQDRGIDYLPVAFPGFSWRNLSASRGRDAPLDAIPRRGGAFLWEQFRSFRKAGAEACYVAMFDELDEGTAIFKIRQDPPAGASSFVAEPGVPGDRYLKLTGQGARLFRGDLPADAPLPPVEGH